MPSEEKSLDIAINLITSLIIAPFIAFFATLSLTFTQGLGGHSFALIIPASIYLGIRQPVLFLWKTINHVKGVRSDLYIPIRIRRKKFWLSIAAFIAIGMLLALLSAFIWF
jgi:hypothetical protein